MALRRVLAELPYRFGSTAVAESEFCRTAFKFFSTTPDGYRFSKSHEWLNKTNANAQEATVGISDYAQNELGDVVFVELPEVGEEVKKGQIFGVVESVKAASDIFSPVSGSVLEVNNKLEEEPQLINKSPFSDGWMMKVKLQSEDEVSSLLDKSAYDAYCDGLGH